jgi:hypothetical protein
VIFREVGSKSESKVAQIEKDSNKVRFELRNKEDDSDESTESNEEVKQPTLFVRRFERVRKPVERYSTFDFYFSFVLTSTHYEPRSVKEAVDLEKSRLWKDIMVEKMESLHKNETWDLVKLPIGINPINSKWVFKKNMKVIGQVEKFKVRLVVKGYSQVGGVVFGEIFSLVAKLTSIRVIIYLAITFDLRIEQIDVKTTFLHGDLEEEIYMKQPEGFVVKGKKDLV